MRTEYADFHRYKHTDIRGTFPWKYALSGFYKAVTDPNHAVICDQNVDELRKIFNRKFPAKVSVLNTFLSIIMTSVTIVKVPEETIPDEKKIRDEKDRPIFRAAIRSGADIFLTGDKDFLESGIPGMRPIALKSAPAELQATLLKLNTELYHLAQAD